jgi:hypothetical protein
MEGTRQKQATRKTGETSAFGESEEAAEMTEKKHPQFRPVDIYPESLLRYLNICPECGNKCSDRDIFCVRCEAEYNRQIYMQSAVKFSRAGFYFRTHEDKIEFSETTGQLFSEGEVTNEIAVLRRPPQYPKYGEFLALSHA